MQTLPNGSFQSNCLSLNHCSLKFWCCNADQMKVPSSEEDSELLEPLVVSFLNTIWTTFVKFELIKLQTVHSLQIFIFFCLMKVRWCNTKPFTGTLFALDWIIHHIVIVLYDNCFSISVKQFGSYRPMSLLWKACWTIMVFFVVAALLSIFVLLRAVLLSMYSA